MSQWTHVRGGLELFAGPYEIKKNKLVEPNKKDFESEEAWRDAYWDYKNKLAKYYYLPYPEEQFKITTPRVLEVYHKPTKKDPSETETVLHVDEAFVYSLPRVKKLLDEAFALLPSGEVGFRYAVKQDCFDSSSCSWASAFQYPCLDEYYKNALEKLYYNEGHWSRFTFDELVEYQKLNKACSVNDVNSMIIGVREDLRYCSAQMFQEGLEKFFAFLAEHNIGVEDGYIEWEDEYDPDHIYVWRKSRISHDCACVFLILDATTNAIVHSKNCLYKKTEDGYWDFEAEGYDIVELDGPYIPKEADSDVN